MKYFIVIDMQNDFCTGALANPEAVKIIPNIKRELINFIEKEKKDGVVIFTRDTHGFDYLETLEGKNLPVVHCIQGTEGWQIVPELTEVLDKYKPTVRIINKNRFGYDNWKNILEPFSEVKIMGTVSSICVTANFSAIKALPEMDITVLRDCCADLTPEGQDAAMKVMAAQQAKIV